MSTVIRTLPVDLVKPILEHLSNRGDLCRCVLVNQAFHVAAVALLYRNIEVGSSIAVSSTTLRPSAWNVGY